MCRYLQRRHLLAAGVLAVAAACAGDRIAGTDGRLREGSAVTLSGTASLIIRTPGGTVSRDLPRWTLAAKVRNGRAEASDDSVHTPVYSPGIKVEDLDTQAARTAASLMRVLAISDRAARQAGSARTAMRAWRDKGVDYTIAIRTGASGGPEAVLFFRNDEPVTLLRYTYARAPGGWQASGASLVSFSGGKPAAALVASADGDVAVENRGDDALLLAGRIAEELAESVIWKRVADALVPPLRADDGSCLNEYLGVFIAGTILAIAFDNVLVSCASATATCGAAIIVYLKAVEEYDKAVRALYKCKGWTLGSSDGAGNAGADIYAASSSAQQAVNDTFSKLLAACGDLSCSMNVM